MYTGNSDIGLSFSDEPRVVQPRLRERWFWVQMVFISEYLALKLIDAPINLFNHSNLSILSLKNVLGRPCKLSILACRCAYFTYILLEPIVIQNHYVNYKK